MPVLIADAQERTALHTGWPIVAGFVLVIALGRIDHDDCFAFDLNRCDLQRHENRISTPVLLPFVQPALEVLSHQSQLTADFLALGITYLFGGLQN